MEEQHLVFQECRLNFRKSGRVEMRKLDSANFGAEGGSNLDSPPGVPVAHRNSCAAASD